MSKKKYIDVSAEAGFIWKIANDVLRDIFQWTEYPDIIYLMVLIRRLECVLEKEKAEIERKFKSGFDRMKVPEMVYQTIIRDKMQASLHDFNSTFKQNCNLHGKATLNVIVWFAVRILVDY